MIRKAIPPDFDYIYGLYMHPQINPFLLYEQMSREAFLPIFNELIQLDQKYIFMDNEQSIGMLKLIPLKHRTSHIVYLGGVAIHPESGGKGYGKKMMLEIIEFARSAGFRRIELSTATTNEKAIHLYGQAGFEKEGVMRQYSWLESEGRYLDEVLMALIL